MLADESGMIDIKNAAFIQSEFTEFVYMDSVSLNTIQLLVHHSVFIYEDMAVGQHPARRPG